MHRSNVVFPAPLGPIKATRRPAGTLRFTPCRIGTFPSVRCRSSTSIASGPLLFGVRRCMIDQGAFQDGEVLTHAMLIGSAAQFAVFQGVQCRNANPEILRQLISQLLWMFSVGEHCLYAMGLNDLTQLGKVPCARRHFGSFLNHADNAQFVTTRKMRESIVISDNGSVLGRCQAVAEFAIEGLQLSDKRLCVDRVTGSIWRISRLKSFEDVCNCVACENRIQPDMEIRFLQ